MNKRKYKMTKWIELMGECMAESNLYSLIMIRSHVSFLVQSFIHSILIQLIK